MMNNKQQLFNLVSLLLPLTVTPVYAALEGALESVNCDVIKGWAWDNTQPTTRLKLDVYDVTVTKTTRLTTLTAQLLRNDLLNAGKGDGKYGFAYLLPASIRNAVTHQFSVRYQGTSTELTNSPKTTAKACYGKLNDTGIQSCSNASTDGLDCPVTGFKGQDGDYGRDALARAGKLAKTGKGIGGFDFTKIANDGSILSDTAQLGSGAKEWACTLDNVTGLLWEVKTADGGGLRYMNNSYSWYNPDNKTNGGYAGTQNGGVCTGAISCDTQAYTTKVNVLKLCGKSNWRVPKKSELLSVVYAGYAVPAIDSAYFPNTVYSAYWTSSPFAGHSDLALIVNFSDGDDNWGNKDGGSYVRLVRSGQ